MKKLVIPLVFLILCSLTIIGCSSTPATSTQPATQTPAQTSAAPPKTSLTPSALNTGNWEKPGATTAAPTTAAPATAAASGETPIVGGTLHISASGGVANLGDPAHLDTPTDNTFRSPCAEGLLRTDADGTQRPWLATDYKIAPDGKSITFTLRKGVKFHDGTPFNAQAVKDCQDIGRTSKEWTNFSAIKSIDVLDEYTVRYNYDQWDWSSFYSNGNIICGQMFSPTALKNHDSDWLRLNPVGTGPYKFVSYTRDVSLRYERFDDYWGPKPNFDAVQYDIFADTTTAMMSFKKGDQQAIAIANFKDCAELEKEGFQLCSVLGSITALFPDSATASSPFSNLKVRQALSYCIDKQKLASAIGYGYFDVNDQCFTPNMIGYDPSIKSYPFDVAKAKQLMKEAGYENGFKTKLLMTSSTPLNMPIAVQAYAKEIGIDIAFEPVTVPKFMSAIFGEGGWEGLAIGSAIAGNGMDPGNSLGNGLLTKGTTWSSMMRQPEAEAIMDQAGSELDVQKRAQQYQQLNKILTDEQCHAVFLYSQASITALSPKLKGHEVGKYGTFIFPYANAWLAK